jgi:hypothetical protein
VAQINKARFHPARLQTKLSDKLLVALTILLSLLVFVVAPLQANGIIPGRYFGLIFGFVLIPAAFMVASNWIAAGSIVFAILLILIASEMEFRQSTIADSFLDAIAWLIACTTLSIVVARAVFGRGKVTYYRIIGGYCFISLLG